MNNFLPFVPLWWFRNFGPSVKKKENSHFPLQQMFLLNSVKLILTINWVFNVGKRKSEIKKICACKKQEQEPAKGLHDYEHKNETFF